MKKIGIVTMIGNGNYGNRLQNYAVQEVYKNLGFDAVTIGRYSRNKNDPRRFFSLKFTNDVLGVISSLLSFFHIDSLKLNAYPRFNKNIKFARRSINGGKTGRIEKMYDFFSVGSDQVWNPQFALYDEDLLRFSPKNKNIAFAASIGVDDLNNCDTEYLKESFLNFAHISVRETRAKEIVEKISERDDVEVFVDPTMMLSNKMWSNVERGGVIKNIPVKKYILITFLSDIDEVWRAQIFDFAALNSLEVVELTPKNVKIFNKVGPAEWIYFIHNAAMVCTDSFHACAFSLNYNVPFLVYQRRFKKNMYSRIETLVNFFSLDDVEYNGIVKMPEIDFDSVNDRIEQERNRTYGILRQWLGE